MEHTVITIARSYGSGGRTLGKLLAKELGIHCYDRELLRMASEQSGINEALFGEVDEKVKSLPLFGISKKIYKGEIFLRKVMISYQMTTFLIIRRRLSKKLRQKNPA